MPALVEVQVLELPRHKRFWGAAPVNRCWPKRGQLGAFSVSVYRSLLRAGLIQPMPRRRRKDSKRWGAWAPMELLELVVLGGFALSDETRAKALTGLDDHSRFAVAARLLHREGTSKAGKRSAGHSGDPDDQDARESKLASTSETA